MEGLTGKCLGLEMTLIYLRTYVSIWHQCDVTYFYCELVNKQLGIYRVFLEIK